MIKFEHNTKRGDDDKKPFLNYKWITLTVLLTLHQNIGTILASFWLLPFLNAVMAPPWRGTGQGQTVKGPS